MQKYTPEWNAVYAKVLQAILDGATEQEVIDDYGVKPKIKNGILTIIKI